MIFSTDACPTCKHKLQLDIVDQGGKVITHYFCPRSPKTVWVGSMAGNYKADVFHYSHHSYLDGSISEMMFEPYVLKHCVPINRTRILYLPEEDSPPELICEIPLLKIDYSNTSYVINKIKTLVLFS